MATQNAIDSQKPIQPALGGTGRSTLTNHGVLVGAGTNAITQLAVGTSGQLLIGATAADPVFATPTSTAGSITYTTGAGTLNLDVANYASNTSFTPGLAFGGGSTGITYTSHTGWYCRLGNMVYVTGSIILSNVGSSTGSVTITGLPFTTNSGQTYIFDIGMVNIGSVSLAVPNILGTSTNTTTISLYSQNGTGVGPVALLNTNFANTSQITFSGWYAV